MTAAVLQTTWNGEDFLTGPDDLDGEYAPPKRKIARYAGRCRGLPSWFPVCSFCKERPSTIAEADGMKPPVWYCDQCASGTGQMNLNDFIRGVPKGVA